MIVNLKGAIVTTMIPIALLALMLIAEGQPPTPHGIAGTIYLIDGSTQVALGSPFRVNDTDSGYFIQDVTSVPIPGFTGRYSVSIDGNDGDFVIVQSWNDSHYGETNLTLSGDMTGIDVILNRTREPEANVTITYPPDSSAFLVENTWQLNATFQLLGSQSGIGCNISLNISDTNVFKIAIGDSYVKELGAVSLDETVNVSFNISGVIAGSTSISVTGFCANSRVNFAGENIDTITNIQASGEAVPSVTLVRPSNNTLNISTHNITFTYQVSHTTDIRNCTLILDGVQNLTHLTPDKDINQNFSVLIPNGQYDWTVNCTDVVNVSGQASPFNLTVAVYVPIIELIFMDDPIDLQAGINTTITCNASVRDDNGISDILVVNATLFDSALSSPQDIDDPNWHYTNDSCTSYEAGSTTANYTCTFPVRYFAYNGSWKCNVTVTDQGMNANTSVQAATINALIALGADAVLDYGSVEAGTISDEKNITVTNLGNIPFNISTNGYGIVEDDNISMICQSSQNISIEQERFAGLPGIGYLSMIPLSSTITYIPDAYLPKRTSDSFLGSSQNQTFWAIQVTSGLKVSSCNGSVVLFATIA